MSNVGRRIAFLLTCHNRQKFVPRPPDHSQFCSRNSRAVCNPGTSILAALSKCSRSSRSSRSSSGAFGWDSDQCQISSSPKDVGHLLICGILSQTPLLRFAEFFSLYPCPLTLTTCNASGVKHDLRKLLFCIFGD